MATDTPGRKAVLGIGNILQSDEGLGVHALNLLIERLGPDPQVELLDGGVMGLDLLPIIEECSHLLVLDAINGAQEPGTVVELAGDQIPLYTGLKMSQHQVTFQEVLALAKWRDKLPPHLHLIGVQPEYLSLGMTLTPVVQAALPVVIERAVAVLSAWDLA